MMVEKDTKDILVFLEKFTHDIKEDVRWLKANTALYCYEDYLVT